MKQSITRRDFLGATLLASGGQLLEPLTPAHFLARQGAPALPGGAEGWNGYGGVGEYANSKVRIGTQSLGLNTSFTF